MEPTARDRSLTRQSVQEIVAGLEREKLVALTDDPDDRRATLVSLTAKGMKRFIALTERWAERANRLARGFDMRELATAQDVIRRLSLDFESCSEESLGLLRRRSGKPPC